jgi:hypothetical protein
MSEFHPIRQVATSAYAMYVKNGGDQISFQTAFDLSEGYILENPNVTLPEAIHEVYLLLMNEV